MFSKRKSEVIEAFESPDFMIKQLESNIAQISVMGKEFIDKNPGGMVEEIDRKAKLKHFKWRFTAAPPDELRFLCATCISELRHALDQITCAAYFCATGVEAGDKLYFPFGNSAKSYEGQVRSTLPTELHPIFEPLGIYRTPGNLALRNNTICILSKAAQKKHRVYCKPTIIVEAYGLNGIEFIPGSSKGAEMHIPPKLIPEKDEILFASIGPGGFYKNKGALHLTMGIFGAEEFSGHSATGTLGAAHHHVSELLNEIRSGVISAI